MNNILKMCCEMGSCEMFLFVLFFGFYGYFKGCGVGLVEIIVRKVEGGGGRGKGKFYYERVWNFNYYGIF